MLQHSVLCRDSGARHCVATRLCSGNRDTLLRQCGVALHCYKEGYAHATDQVGCARQGWRTKAGCARQRYSVTIEVFCHNRDFSVATDFLQR